MLPYTAATGRTSLIIHFRCLTEISFFFMEAINKTTWVPQYSNVFKYWSSLHFIVQSEGNGSDNLYKSFWQTCLFMDDFTKYFHNELKDDPREGRKLTLSQTGL